MNFLWVFGLVVLVPFLAGSSLAYQEPRRVYIGQVEAITLQRGQMTTARRVSAVPQLKCVGGSASRYTWYRPKVVQCKAQGFDSSGSMQWRCEADMDNRYRFGKITVVCEGWDHPTDRYILEGSCGLEYELDYNELESSDRQNNLIVVSILAVLGGILGFSLLVGCIAYWNAPSETNHEEESTITTKWDSAYDDDDGDSGEDTAINGASAPPRPRKKRNSKRQRYHVHHYYQQPTYRRSRDTDSSFWEGAAWGGLTGYSLGSSSSSRNCSNNPTPSSYSTSTPSSSGSSSRGSSGGGSWFSSGSSGGSSVSVGFGGTRGR